MDGSQDGSDTKVPVFLLKTKSSPADAYEEHFTKTQFDGVIFEPEFVPVLEHRFLDAGMDRVRSLLRGDKICQGLECEFGGLIFTSQRAVEAFTKLAVEEPDLGGWSQLQHVPVYSVGPATTRALKAVLRQQPGLQIYGEHTGNGETLAPFILDHYGEWYKDRATKPPLLFLVGEQRRDVIPRVLMDDGLAPSRRIRVDEVVVYGTGVMQSFEEDFASRLALAADAGRRTQWVVVFSPTGCDSMLRGLERGSGSTSTSTSSSGTRRLVATIGPTTKSFLETSFGFKPDVCAEMPSPEGVLSGITKYMTNSR